MSDTLGMVQLAPPENRYLGGGGWPGASPIAPETAERVDAEVQRIIAECHQEAVRLLREHRAALDTLVAALLERETLDEREILEATGLPPAPVLLNRPLADAEH
jgi:cell division protease FtsH